MSENVQPENVEAELETGAEGVAADVAQSDEKGIEDEDAAPAVAQSDEKEIKDEDSTPAGTQSEGNAIENEEKVSQKDEISLLGDSDDDTEQTQSYLEYLELVKRINCQNQTIDEMKAEIRTLWQQPCKTRCDLKTIQCLRQSIEEEFLKLQCLMEKARRLQNFGSRRRYHDLPIATTLEEDDMASS